MSIEQNVGNVMTEIGPLAGLCAVRAYPGKRMWQLAVDEDTIVYADLAPWEHTLALSAELGPAPGGRREEFFELLLRYAHAWRETGGLRISIAEGDARLWLLRDCCAVDLGAQQFAVILSDYVAKIHAWREGIRAYEDTAARPPSQHEPVRLGSLRA
jgi:hypothetical protein